MRKYFMFEVEWNIDNKFRNKFDCFENHQISCQNISADQEKYLQNLFLSQKNRKF